MAEIINLRRHRKVKDRAEAEVKAAENRVLHGRTKAQRAQDRLAAELARKRLDGARRDEP